LLASLCSAFSQKKAGKNQKKKLSKKFQKKIPQKKKFKNIFGLTGAAPYFGSVCKKIGGLCCAGLAGKGILTLDSTLFYRFKKTCKILP
jgi:hypothetical protein